MAKCTLLFVTQWADIGQGVGQTGNPALSTDTNKKAANRWTNVEYSCPTGQNLTVKFFCASLELEESPVQPAKELGS
jgi:hypothetical protein